MHLEPVHTANEASAADFSVRHVIAAAASRKPRESRNGDRRVAALGAIAAQREH
jgi:hypothetical protein